MHDKEHVRQDAMLTCNHWYNDCIKHNRHGESDTCCSDARQQSV